MAEIRYYVAAGGAAPSADWFAKLDAIAGAKITRAVARDFADGWDEESAAAGYRGSAWLLAGY